MLFDFRALLAMLAMVGLLLLTPDYVIAGGAAGHSGGTWSGHAWNGSQSGSHTRGGRLWGGDSVGPIVGNYPYPAYDGYFNAGPNCTWMRQYVNTPYGPQWHMIPVC
jgi:hypothetical protein